MSGHINHVGNFRRKIKFCYNIHLCLLEETVQGSIDHAASFLPCFCKFTSGVAREIRMVADGLWEVSRDHLIYCVVIQGRRAAHKVPQSPLNGGLLAIGAWQTGSCSFSAHYSTSPCTEHTHRPHPTPLSIHSWGWFLWSFVF